MWTADKEFVVYTRPDCSFCVKAKSLLTEKGKEYTEVNIEEHLEELEYFLKKGFKTVPQIFINIGKERVYIGGYTDLTQFFSDAELQQNK